MCPVQFVVRCLAEEVLGYVRSRFEAKSAVAVAVKDQVNDGENGDDEVRGGNVCIAIGRVPAREDGAADQGRQSRRSR